MTKIFAVAALFLSACGPDLAPEFDSNAMPITVADGGTCIHKCIKLAETPDAGPLGFHTPGVQCLQYVEVCQ